MNNETVSDEVNHSEAEARHSADSFDLLMEKILALKEVARLRKRHADMSGALEADIPPIIEKYRANVRDSLVEQILALKAVKRLFKQHAGMLNALKNSLNIRDLLYRSRAIYADKSLRYKWVRAKLRVGNARPHLLCDLSEEVPVFRSLREANRGLAVGAELYHEISVPPIFLKLLAIGAPV